MLPLATRKGWQGLLAQAVKSTRQYTYQVHAGGTPSQSGMRKVQWPVPTSLLENSESAAASAVPCRELVDGRSGISAPDHNQLTLLIFLSWAWHQAELHGWSQLSRESKGTVSESEPETYHRALSIAVSIHDVLHKTTQGKGLLMAIGTVHVGMAGAAGAL